MAIDTAPTTAVDDLRGLIRIADEWGDLRVVDGALKDDFPVVNSISPELKARMLEKWAGRLDFLSESGA